ncbi:hypothetical protein RDABS01_028795 [Bienertia sinuspersici]
MAVDLVDVWKKFNLTEDEEIEIDLDEIPMTRWRPKWEAMKSVLRASWKPLKGMAVREIDKNLFVFQFFCPTDKSKVIDQSPWSFDNHLLLFKEIPGREQPKDLIFNTVDFWVKIYNVPFMKRSRALANIIGNKIGQFLDYDESDISGWTKYMRIRVRMNVNKPLPRGSTMKLSGERLWVDIRIERLPGFCYSCGCLGHVLCECNDYDEEVPESELPYGQWLRVSPVKLRGRGNNPDKDVEKKLFQELRDNAKRKLKFNGENSLGNYISAHINPLVVGTSGFSGGEGKGNQERSESDEDRVNLKRHASTDGVSNRGRAGGLALLWSDEVIVELMSMSSHHIDVSVKSNTGDLEWRFTGIHGWTESMAKHLTCELIEDLHKRSGLPWLIGGDLNEVFYNYEKKGVGQKTKILWRCFGRLVSSVIYGTWILRGILLLGGMVGRGHSIEERLDRYLANSSWSALFSWAEVSHLDECLSDHLLILLRLDAKGGEYGRRRRRFHFENMWALEDSCEEVIGEKWNEVEDVNPIWSF